MANEEGVYNTQKVDHHPEIVGALKACSTQALNPTLIHFMPQNVCNQSCSFCSYRLEGGKNAIDITKMIPIEKMHELFSDFETMGVKAIEVTGGGEPLAHPDRIEMLQLISRSGMDLGLVTNGTLLTDEVVAEIEDCNLLWARVSIDSSNVETYCEMRRARPSHWEKAWSGIRRLVDLRNRCLARGKFVPTIGVGFVTNENNYNEVFDLCKMAKDAGVQSVRISMAFTPQGQSLLTERQHEVASSLSRAADYMFSDSRFKVSNLFDERYDNMEVREGEQYGQDYDYCPTKDVLCVIEGEQKVYTCCTLTGDPRGLVGSIEDQSFKALWEEKQGWRGRFNARKTCTCECLYEKRNKHMNGISDGTVVLDESADPPPHVNFI